MGRDITIRLNGAALVAILAVGVLALLVASSAAIADEPGVEYYACVTAGGDLTDVSIDEIPDCKKNKSLIHWNEAGPVGPAGPAGPEGPAGPQGPAGEITWENLWSSHYTRGESFRIDPGTGEQLFQVGCDLYDLAINVAWSTNHPSVDVMSNLISGGRLARVVVRNDDMTTPTGSARIMGVVITCLDTNP